MNTTWFWHKHNIEAKASNDKNNTYRAHKTLFENLLKNEYATYHCEQMKITGTSEVDVRKRIDLLVDYYDYIDKFIRSFPISDKRKSLSAQAKLRPTILEEFCGYLFKDLEEINKLHLNFFNKSIFSGLGLNNTGKPEVKTKDVDFCIGKETTAEFESLQSKFIIPLVAVECKTYVDKTMFGEAQFTAQLIKNGTPDARVYILAERNEIGKGKIPTLTPLDQYFTLKKNEKSPIVPEVVIDFFSEVQKVLSNATTHRVRDPPGRMIPK